MEVIRYTWQDVAEDVKADGYATEFCPVCGDLLIALPGEDVFFQGTAQRDNEHHQAVCLDVILGF